MEASPVCFAPEHFGAYLSGRRNFLRFELSVAAGAEGDPFVRVASSSRSGALYLGRLRSNDGAIDRPAVLKVLADGRTGGGPGPNGLRDHAFLEEYRALRLLREGDEDPLLRLAPFDVKTGGGVDLPRLLPLVFCRHRQLFFNPRCPLCAEPLRDCRDDAVLARAGLAAYPTASSRYLHCPRCSVAEESGSVRFYAHAPAGGDLDNPAVGDADDLIRALGDLASRGPAGVPEFPCAECAARAACFPAEGGGAARERLWPFSFHDFYAFLHEFLPLRWGDACDLLGAAAAAPEPGASGPPGLFFEADAPRRALELLLLALRLCGDLHRGVLCALSRFGAPHAALGPGDAWVDPAVRAGGTPGLWGLRVRVTPPDAAVAPEPARGADLSGLGALTLQALAAGLRPGEAVRAAALSAAAEVRAGRLDGARARARLRRDLGPPGGVPAALWDRALEVAFGLLLGEGGDSVQRALHEGEALAAEVHRLTFVEPPCPAEELAAVLRELVDDPEWLAAVAAGRPPAGEAPPAARPPPPSPEADLEATILLGRRPPPAAPPPPRAESEPEDLERTVLLSPRPGAGGRP